MCHIVGIFLKAIIQYCCLHPFSRFLKYNAIFFKDVCVGEASESTLFL